MSPPRQLHFLLLILTTSALLLVLPQHNHHLHSLRGFSSSDTGTVLQLRRLLSGSEIQLHEVGNDDEPVKKKPPKKKPTSSTPKDQTLSESETQLEELGNDDEPVKKKPPKKKPTSSTPKDHTLSKSETQQEETGYHEDDDDEPVKKKPSKKKPSSSTPKDQTPSEVVESKPDKPKPKPKTVFGFSSSKNQTTKAFASSKNSTKPIKPKLSGVDRGTKNSSKLAKASGGGVVEGDVMTKVELKKLNSTTAKVAKKFNSTAKAADLGKPGKDFGKKGLDLVEKKANMEKAAKKVEESKGLESEKKSEGVKVDKKADPEKKKKKSPKEELPSLDVYGSGVGETGEDEDDLVAQFRDLPAEFHRSLLPDLERISAASKSYVGKANERMTKNFRPYVGKRYASTAAAAASFTFVVVPMIIVSLIVRHMKDHLSVQRTIIFVHVYLAVYFSILCVSTLLTGVEPLRFFDATAHSTYTFLQVVQMVGYTLYLVLLFLYLFRTFAWGSSPGTKLLVLAQVAVGYAIGIHYYVIVLHRAVSHTSHQRRVGRSTGSTRHASQSCAS